MRSSYDLEQSTAIFIPVFVERFDVAFAVNVGRVNTRKHTCVTCGDMFAPHFDTCVATITQETYRVECSCEQSRVRAAVVATEKLSGATFDPLFDTICVTYTHIRILMHGFLIRILIPSRWVFRCGCSFQE